MSNYNSSQQFNEHILIIQMNTSNETVEQKLRFIQEAVATTLEMCRLEESDFMFPVKIVVDPICPCKTENISDQVTHESYMRCRSCENVYHK